MQRNYSLRCPSDDSIYEDDLRQQCEKCGNFLIVKYDVNRFGSKTSIQNSANRMWKFKGLLPVTVEEDEVSLGEGSTPLIWSKIQENEEDRLGFKIEYANPTCSFKDRSASLLITKAKSVGSRSAVVDSSGNAAAAIAAYSARAQLECHVFVPEKTSPDKINQISSYGASISKIEGMRQDVLNSARAHALNTNGYYCGFQLNPFASEATKTVAYEIAQQMNWSVPDFVIAPMGTGGLLIGCAKGFREMIELDWTHDMPKIVGVQPEGCSPIVNSFLTKKKIVPIDHPETVAEGLKIGHPYKGEMAISEITKSHGVGLSVRDDEILRAGQYLAMKQGLYSEPSGAVSTAGFLKLREDGFFSSDEKIVCLVTGSGLKTGKLYQ